MTGIKQLLRILACFLLSSLVSAIKCYYCDNSVSSACGQEFKAYQFEARPCPEHNGTEVLCGKQEQPPDKSGWVGVIRSCYYSGELPGINETVGCRHYFHDVHNFSAFYCFCDTDYCNGGPPISSAMNYVEMLVCLIMIRVLFWRILRMPIK